MRTIITAMALMLSVYAVGQDSDTARIIYYNVLNYPGTTPERVEHFKKVMAYAQPDVLVINELINEGGADNLLSNGLNVYGVSHFQRAAFVNGEDSDNMLFYNADLFSLYSQDTIHTELRLINRYTLFNNNSALQGDTVFLDFYSAHLKASSGTANEEQRLREMQEFTSYINELNNAQNIFFGGDLNFYDAGELAYQHLINNATVPISDPLGETWAGNWHDNESYANIHTQSTRSRQFGGGAHGGLDDRFDFIFMSDDVLAGNNYVQWLEGSYMVLGNDGNHFNDSINALPNAAVPDSIAHALHYFSDHLPVMADIAVSIPEIISSIEIASPQAGDILINGSETTIEWQSENVLHVDISYKLFDEVEFTLIEPNLEAAPGAYNWIIPTSLEGDAYIKVESSSDPLIADTSGMFTIRSDIGVEFVNSNIETFNVSPNPSNGKILINLFGNHKPRTLRIVSLHGQLLKSIQVKNGDTIKLAKGVYILQIESSQKLVVVN